MENVKHAGKAVNEKVLEVEAGAQKELDKNIAQNPGNTAGERVKGAVGAAGNKISEKTHELKKDYHENRAGITSDKTL